uniref:LRAT domain-containing protein n=1 Tax=Malurus cyaneus samueli TaxID=2593467 RepID=A0A8C5UJE9_9PASS
SAFWPCFSLNAHSDMPRDKRDPNRGDLIEIKRQGYQHWALYVGDGYVIHVDKWVFGVRAWVKKEPLKDVMDWYRPPFPTGGAVIRRAESWIDKEVPMMCLSNCEHFVTTLRYGEGLSFQVRILHGNTVFSAGVIGLLGVFSSAYCSLCTSLWSWYGWLCAFNFSSV